MKEILFELSKGRYNDLPAYQKRMFWCCVEHFMHTDNQKFIDVWALVSRWALEEDKHVKIMPDLEEKEVAHVGAI